MKKFRIVSLFLCISMLIGMLPFAAAANESIDEPIFDYEVNFLKKLGVTEEGYEPYFQMTRAEYVKLIAKIMYHGAGFETHGGNTEAVFSDVSAENEYYPYIKACSDLKIINGHIDGKFRPEDLITFNEAVAITVNALGYTVYAEAAGGYPTGYIAVAKNTGILSGISADYTPTGYILCKMIYNSLFADLVTINSISEGNISFEVKADNNILSARLGIEEYDARVVDNGLISITGTASIEATDRVVLENVSDGVRNIFYVGDTDIASCIGSRVKAFVKQNQETGKNEIIYYSVHKSNVEILFNADDILSMDASGIQYENKEENNGKIYRKSFTSGGPVAILNGQHITSNISECVPDDGIVRAVDYNEDGRIDFVDIISFNIKAENGNTANYHSAARNIVVGKINKEDNYIGCKFYPKNGISLEEANYRFILNDKVKSIEDLKEDDIISVAQSPVKIGGKYLYQLAVERKAITGKAQYVSASENLIGINDREYEVSSGLTSVKNGFLSYVNLDLSYTFSLDITGKIAYSKNLASSTKNYAYLIALAHRAAPYDEVVGKFFTKDGEIKEYKFASKVTVDGALQTDAADIYASIKKREAGSNPAAIGVPSGTASSYYDNNPSRPVIIQLNSNEEINAIDTDNLNYAGAQEVTQYTSETLIPYSQTEIDDVKALKAGYRSPRIEELTRYTNSVSGRFYVSDDSLVMMVPDIDIYDLDRFSQIASNKVDASYNYPFEYNMIKLYENDISDENYKITAGSSLDRVFAYDIQGYDIDPDTGVASLVVIRGNTQPYIYGRVPYDTTYPLKVYLRKTPYYDSEREKTVTKIYYTSDGVNEESAIVDLDETLYVYRYLIEGSNASDTPYNMAYKALEEGDIIRVIKSGGELAHIERVYHIDTVNNAYSSGLYPSFPRVMYSTALTGISALPSDEREYYAGFMSGYHLGVVYPKSLNGGNMIALMGERRLSDVDLTDPSSFVVQNIDTTAMSYLLIEIDSTNTVKNVTEGTESDIKTIDEYSKDEASILVYHNIYHQINKIIIINRV